MAPDWHFRLESALRERMPRLVEYLNAGLTEQKVRKLLSKSRVTGAVEVLVAVYTWRDGTRLTPELVTDPQSPILPGTEYHLLDLELALAHFDHGRVVGKKNPRLAEGAGRYFPLFWNGHTGWLATDIEPAYRNRMMIVDHDDPVPFRQASESFDAFIAEAIRAIEERRDVRLP